MSAQNIDVAPVNYDEILKEHKLYGVVAEFDDPHDLVSAAYEVRKQGYTKLEAFSPFPVHGIDDALGEKRSPLGYLVFCGGCCGLLFGFLLQYWTSAVDYRIMINGKPFFTLESSIPVMFESTILFSAFTAVFGMLLINGLPRLYHPIFKYQEYHRATDDAFLLAILAKDPKFSVPGATQALEGVGAKKTEAIEE